MEKQAMGTLPQHEVTGASDAKKDEAASGRAPKPGSRLSKCPICSSMVADLDKHMRKARHDPNGAAALRPRPKPPEVSVERDAAGFVCPFCSARWPNAVQLKSHVAGIHGSGAFAALKF